jgi:tRNA threonylcarbamoyladenosine biosynthesis protein TsaE
MANANTHSRPTQTATLRISKSPGETQKIAAEIAMRCQSGAVIALTGDLGVGKTEFVKGLAAALGCDGPVTSPTFAIAHEYPGLHVPLYHFDFYRMEDESEFVTCGFEECVGEGVVVAEWAEKFKDRLPANTVWILIEAGEESTRHFHIHGL